MKKILTALALLLSLAACQKDSDVIKGCTDPTAGNYNSAANTNNGSCVYYGNVVFYNTSAQPGGVLVNCGSQSGVNTHYFVGSVPACGTVGCATFNLPVGTYNYTALSAGGTWNGSVTITQNGCAQVALN